MAINRFYNPQRGQYISQFVPTQLPADLMLGIIQNKRKQADAEIARGEQYADALLKIQAIKNSVDEAKLGEYQTKLRDYLNTTVGKVDLASAQGQREYREMLKTFSPLQNKDLSSIQGRYDYAQSIEKEREEMRKDPTKYGEGVYFKSYDLSMKDFLKQKEFNKNYAFSSKEHITAGIDRYKYYEDFYNNLVANSSEGSSKISDDLGSAYYKISNEGISYKRIQGRTGEVLATAMNSPAGTQTRREVINEIGLTMEQYNSLSQENKDKIEQETAKRVTEGLMAAGKEKIYSKTGNDKASALNKLEDRGYQKAKEIEEGLYIPSTLQSETKVSNEDVDKAISNINNNLKQAYVNLRDLEAKKSQGINVSDKDIENSKKLIQKLNSEKSELKLIKKEEYNNILKGEYDKFEDNINTIGAKYLNDIVTGKMPKQDEAYNEYVILNKGLKKYGNPQEAKNRLKELERTNTLKGGRDFKTLNEIHQVRTYLATSGNFVRRAANEKWSANYLEKDNTIYGVSQPFISIDGGVQNAMKDNIINNLNSYTIGYINEDQSIEDVGIKNIQIKEIKGLTMSENNIKFKDGSVSKGNGYRGQATIIVPVKNSEGEYVNSKGEVVSNVSQAATKEVVRDLVFVPGTSDYQVINRQIAERKRKEANIVTDPLKRQELNRQAYVLEQSDLHNEIQDFKEVSSVKSTPGIIKRKIGDEEFTFVLERKVGSDYTKVTVKDSKGKVLENHSYDDVHESDLEPLLVNKILGGYGQ